VAQVRSSSFRLWLAAVVGVLLTAAAAAAFVFLSSREDRIALAAAISVAAVLAIAWVASRFRRVDSQLVKERLRLQEEADEAERKYRTHVEGLPLVTWIYDAGDRSVTHYVSPQAETMLGYSREHWESEGDLFSKALHGEDRERVRAEVERATENGTPFVVEYRLVAEHGDVVWIREHGVTVRSSEGEPLFGRSFLLDIGERKRAYEERDRVLAAERAAVSEKMERQRRLDLLREGADLLASSVEYKSTVQRVADLVVRDFADWCVVDVSDEGSAFKRLAVARAEPPAKGGGVPDQQTEEAVRVVVESGRPEVVPPLGGSSNGQEGARFLGGVDVRSVICVPLRARDRRLGAITVARTKPGNMYDADDLAFVEDLASRIAAAIERARLYLEVEERADAARVLAHVADGVLLLDRNGVVRLWNPAAEGITAIKAANVVGRSAVEVFPRWQEIVDAVPVSTSPDPGHDEIVVPIETQMGERWIAISGVQFFGGTVYAFRDLTEVHRLEELKADFIATASHELRTPLAAVYGAAQTLLRHDFALDEGGRDRFVSLIAEESERLSRIVNEILLANQLDAGRLDLEAEAFDAVEVVERVVEATRAYAPPGISVDLISPEHVPYVAADRDKVRQVLVNLVENAIKYSPDGGRVEVAVEAHDDDRALFSVRDEGLGIPAEERARIFQKFYRVDPQMTRGVGGTGLGLYICNELVSRMGGRIWVEPNEEQGSTFLFELAAAEPSAVQRVAADSSEREASRSPAPATNAPTP
jgi:PAS domain S-box-containing protein